MNLIYLKWTKTLTKHSESKKLNKYYVKFHTPVFLLVQLKSLFIFTKRQLLIKFICLCSLYLMGPTFFYNYV